MPERGSIFPPDHLDRIETHDIGEWEGTVWRHMFAHHPPNTVNEKGARWNPPGVGAIYTSLNKETALAEAEFMIAAHRLRPRADRTIYELRVTVEKVADLRDASELAALGVDDDALGSLPAAPCQFVGEMVSWLGFGGLLVPSARHDGANLVIYERNLGVRFSFEEVSTTALSSSGAPESTTPLD